MQRPRTVWRPNPKCSSMKCRCGAPVAQLDRASGFEPEGWEFKSLRARHSRQRHRYPTPHRLRPHRDGKFRFWPLENERDAEDAALGSRPRIFWKRAYSSGERPCLVAICGVTLMSIAIICGHATPSIFGRLENAMCLIFRGLLRFLIVSSWRLEMPLGRLIPPLIESSFHNERGIRAAGGWWQQNWHGASVRACGLFFRAKECVYELVNPCRSRLQPRHKHRKIKSVLAAFRAAKLGYFTSLVRDGAFLM
jgi:hypothetical protein